MERRRKKRTGGGGVDSAKEEEGTRSEPREQGGKGREESLGKRLMGRVSMRKRAKEKQGG